MLFKGSEQRRNALSPSVQQWNVVFQSVSQSICQTRFDSSLIPLLSSGCDLRRPEIDAIELRHVVNFTFI